MNRIFNQMRMFSVYEKHYEVVVIVFNEEMIKLISILGKLVRPKSIP